MPINAESSAVQAHMTILQGDSRFLIACEGLPRPTLAYVLPVVERAFCERGLPAVIRSDNGPPFASTGLGGLTAFAVHLVKLGITPERITPGGAVVPQRGAGWGACWARSA